MELLEKIPHRCFLNLAIVYFAVIDNVDNGRGIVTIYNNHLEHWKVGEELLYKLAMKNTPVLYPAELKPMNQVVSDMILKEDRDIDVDTLIAGKTFVITGSVEHFANRNEIKALIESLGGKVAGSVSSKTDYLINNDTTSNSSKNQKAKELGIPIISEGDFINMTGKKED